MSVTKTCKSCQTTSLASAWYTVKGKIVGLLCKSCYNLKKKAEKALWLSDPSNREKFNKQQTANKARYRADKVKAKALSTYRKEYYNKTSTVATREKASKASAKSFKERKASCPTFAGIVRLRKLLHTSFSRHGYSKTSRTHKILGASFEKVMQHLGCPNGIPEGYEIDHVIPMALAYNEASAVRLNHFTNLQLLTKVANREKQDILPNGINASSLSLEEKKAMFAELTI